MLWGLRGMSRSALMGGSAGAGQALGSGAGGRRRPSRAPSAASAQTADCVAVSGACPSRPRPPRPPRSSPAVTRRWQTDTPGRVHVRTPTLARDALDLRGRGPRRTSRDGTGDGR